MDNNLYICKFGLTQAYHIRLKGESGLLDKPESLTSELRP